MMTQEQLIERLRLEAEHESRSAVARRYGFSLSYIAKVLDGDLPVGERLAKQMGYRRVTRFEPLGRGA